MEVQQFHYDNKIVKQFIWATIIWGVVGMIVGLLVALQLAWPIFNFNLEAFTFGHMRPLHTNAIIFAFIGNSIFAGVYYSLQKLLKTRMASDTLSQINFWGWQLIIVLAAITLTLGFTTSKEYAELEWPIDILIAIVWVVYGVNMIWTMTKRRTQHIYAAIWWYLATFIGVALLHVVNSFEIPVTFFKSYSAFAGASDAVVQWWYGHNAVAFFLTTPFLGLMYYYLPKAANRPIYSYKLSIIHFWSLIFLYMWAGPHHLLYQALPAWAQALGTTFSIMLWAPSWGGMINGLLTLRGAWDKVRESAALKFMVIAVTAYGMSTFEGPMLSLKNVNAISHFTDWTIAHVHIGGMAWNGGLTFGMLYWLIPILFRTKLFSEKLANIHFWISTLGILLYAIPLYWGAITQWLMWREFTPEGLLLYPNFLETVTQILPMYQLRVFGGALYLIGFVIMVYNVVKTMKTGHVEDNELAEAASLRVIEGKEPGETPHRWLERKPLKFAFWALIALFIGGAIEIIPMTFIKTNVPTIESVTPYSPLELEGRDIYVSNGCYTCHSQMVRPFRWETERYGQYSKIGEFVYDHPFQWGSKRTGPDLARAGDPLSPTVYKSVAWHYSHFMSPQKMNQQSIMPSYSWFATEKVDMDVLPKKIRTMQTLGVPYPEGYDQQAVADYKAQAEKIVAELKTSGIEADPESEMIAMIAYLHKLGRDISSTKNKEE